MATLKDVAKLACVDVSTVSRALNNTSYVHPDTKARILAAVKELSYQPNVLAKGLRQGKRHTIGIVVPRLSMTVFAELIQGIDEEARYHGHLKSDLRGLRWLRAGSADSVFSEQEVRRLRLHRLLRSQYLQVQRYHEAHP